MSWHSRHRHGNWFSTRRQPPLHKLDLVRLRAADARAQRPQVLVLRVRRNQRRHLHRLRMMHDHALHELHVRLRPWRQLCRCGRRQRPARLTRRTRLHHYRGRRISLLCARSRAEKICWSDRYQEQATQPRKCSWQTGASACGENDTATSSEHCSTFRLGSMKACHGILTFSKILSRQTGLAQSMSPFPCITAQFPCGSHAWS